MCYYFMYKWVNKFLYRRKRFDIMLFKGTSSKLDTAVAKLIEKIQQSKILSISITCGAIWDLYINNQLLSLLFVTVLL